MKTILNNMYVRSARFCLDILINAHLLDWRYGTDHPSKKEIGRMSAREYKNRLQDMRFRRWVSYVCGPISDYRSPGRIIIRQPDFFERLKELQ